MVWLSRYGVWAVARYQEVHAVLNDWRTFCSGRGVGMADFAKEKPWRPPNVVLETDPPEHDRARAVLNRVLSPAAMKQLRAGFAAAAEAKVREIVRKSRFDAIAELAQAFPLSVFPDAVGLRRVGREHLLPTPISPSTHSARRTSYGSKRSSAPLHTSPGSTSSASVRTSPPAGWARRSMLRPIRARSPRTRHQCWCARS